MKILLLEDDEVLNITISEYLKRIGHEIISTKTGNECLDILKKENFDFVLLDINVPNIDGLSILERLYNEKRAMPSIIISAIIDIQDISKAFKIGCYDYLKKPFHLNELNIRINKILQTKQSPMIHKRLSSSYSYDSENSTLYFNNEPQTITHRQNQIIELLSKNRSIVCSYDMFRYYVYNDEYIDNSTIIAEINRLKKSLKDNFIINVRNVGYIIKRPN